MPEQVQTCYDDLAAEYHLIFEDWNASIARQARIIGPYLETEAGGSQPLRILDCACGIGTQTLGLAQRGHRVTGSDLSPGAIARARSEASARGLNVQFCVADMRDLSVLLADGFDAVVCLDNSLPHLESVDQLREAASQVRAKLRPGGIFLAGIRDYDYLVCERPNVQGPCFYESHGQRRIIHQIWDWIDRLHYTFHLYITRQVAQEWMSNHYTATYRAVLRDELTSAVQAAGFAGVQWLLPAETDFYQPILMAKAAKPD